MEQTQCEFCNKPFSTISNLNHHKKTAKYCIKLQNREDNQFEFKCKSCERFFSSKVCLSRHYSSCKVIKSKNIKLLQDRVIELESETQHKFTELESKFQTEQEKVRMLNISIENYKQQIENYKQQVESLQQNQQEITLELAKKPTTKTTTINNKCTTLVNFAHSEEDIKRIISEKYTKSHLYQGQKGAAEFAGKHIFGNEDGQLSLTCTDTARLSFTFRDKEGNIVKDPKGFKAVECVRIPLKEGAKKIYLTLDDDCQEYFAGMFDELELMEIDSATFRNRLACVVSE